MIFLNASGWWIEVKDNKDGSEHFIEFEQFGKTVFFTKEQAEAAALEEGK